MTRNPSYFYIFLAVNLVSFICLEKWNLIGLRLTFLITIVYFRTIGIYSVFAQILSDMRPNNYAVSEQRLTALTTFSFIFQTSREDRRRQRAAWFHHAPPMKVKCLETSAGDLDAAVFVTF